jgi:hypothetical protein
MSELHFSGEVNAQGKLLLDDRPAFVQAVADLAGQRVVMTLERWVKRRSGQQNRWYWGVIVPAVGSVLSRTRDVPLSKDQVHYVLAAAFLGCDVTQLGPVPSETHVLDTAQFSTYCEAIRAHAASEWGLNIPAPNEPHEEAA